MRYFAIVLKNDNNVTMLFVINTWILCKIMRMKHLVDISYMVADFKYSQENGLKICEVQQGSLSSLNGDLYISSQNNNKNIKENNGDISPKIVEFLNQFPIKKWMVGSFFKPLKRCLRVSGWNNCKSFRMLTRDPEFLECSKLIPSNQSSISSYAGIVYTTYDTIQNVNSFHDIYPGIIFIDKVTLNYWNDKCKMNALFDNNVELKQYKADWKLYPRKYDLTLAQQIKEEIPSNFYVVKPTNAFLGYGVIVVENENLDRTLQIILEPQSDLIEKFVNDKGYTFWYKNNCSTFLIEKYYESDYLQFRTNDCFELNYDATMRIAFILKYDNGLITYHPMGGFWKLPCKALEEIGTLNEKRISSCSSPFYKEVDLILLEKINKKLELAMLLFYETMLSR